MSIKSSVKTVTRAAPGPPTTQDLKALYQRGDFWFFLGLCICGTWVLGPIGAPMILFGAYLIRKAEKSGYPVRPWTVTMVGGLALVDAAVNGLAWGLDLFAPQTWLCRNLWMNYGMAWDGAYALFYNSQALGGVAEHAEKGWQIASVLFVMPIKGMAAWGFLKMKRWGLQWLILGNWLYLALWVPYSIAMSANFELRFGTSDFGVLGFWLMAGIPFCGPCVLLPYLHTVNREIWSK